MKIMKKFLAILLAVVTIFTSAPLTSAKAVAEENCVTDCNPVGFVKETIHDIIGTGADLFGRDCPLCEHTPHRAGGEGWFYKAIHCIVGFFSDTFDFKCPLCDDGLHGKEEDPGVTIYRKVTFAYPSSLEASETEGFNMPESEMVEEGTLVYALKIPETPGYVFGGWSYDEANTQIASEKDVITKDITLYPYLIESAETTQEIVESPNFSAVVDADAASYAVVVKADSEETIKKYLFIADIGSGNVQKEAAITANADGTYNVVPADGFIPGGTYQFNAMDRLDKNVSPDNYIQFVENGEILDKNVQFYNVTLYKDEFDNVRIDEDVIFVSVNNVDGFSFDNTALFTASVSDGDVDAKKNNTTGSFEYNGEKALKVGDIIAIHTGEYSAENHMVAEKESVSYVRITKVEGTTCHYEIPGAEEVLFMPEMFPIDKNALGVTMSEDKTTLTVPEKLLEIEGSAFGEEVGLGADFTADVGDFIAYAGENVAAEEGEYYEILSITRSDDYVTFKVKPITEEYIENSADMYVQKSISLELTDEEIASIEQQIRESFDGETYGTMAANYVSSLLEVGGAEELFPGLDTEGMAFTVTNSQGEQVTLAPEELKEFAESEAQLGTQGVEAGVGVNTFNVKFGKVDVEPKVSMGTKNLKNITSLKDGRVGMRAAISVYVPLEIQMVLVGATSHNSGSWNTVMSSLDLDLTASFDFEFGLDAELDFDTQWKKKKVWIFPVWYIYDFVVKASLDVGLYTGAGAVFTMNTGAYEDAYNFDNFISSFDSTYQPGQIEIGNLAKTLESMMNEPYDFFGSETGERTLWDDYKDMLEIETEYFDLLPVFPEMLMKKRFYLDTLHTLQMEVSANIIISASANINVGMSFEHLDAKRYSVTFGLLRNNKSYNVTKLQNNYTNFNFYCMGQIGLRVGVRVSAGIGILSVKTNNITLTIECGPYLKLHGFFYVHYDRNAKGKNTVYHGGLFHVEIGVYGIIELTGDILGLAGFYVQFMEEEWPIYTIGSENNIVGTTKAQVKNNASPQKTSDGKYEIPVRFTPDLRIANVLTGDTSIQKKNLSTSDYTISVISDNVRLKRIDSNTIYLEPINEFTIETFELSAEIRVTYMRCKMPMSTNPITTVIDYDWQKTDPKYRLTFEVGEIDPLSTGELDYAPFDISEHLSEMVYLEGTKYSDVELPDYTPPEGFYWNNEWARAKPNTNSNDYSEWTVDYEIIDFENDVIGVDEGDGYVDTYKAISIRPVIYLKKDIQYKIRHMVQTEESGYKDYELYKEDTFNDGFVGMNEFIEYRDQLISSPNQCNIMLSDFAIDIEGYSMNDNKNEARRWIRTKDGVYNVELASVINPDGSTVLAIYYDIDEYRTYIGSNVEKMYKYTSNGKTGYWQDVPYGHAPDTTIIEQTNVPGYTFKGWREYTFENGNRVYGELMDELPVIKRNLESTDLLYFEAYYEPNDDTEYTVIVSMKQVIGDYLPVYTATYEGTTDQPIDYQTIVNDARTTYPEEFEYSSVNPAYLIKNGTMYGVDYATIDGDGTSVFEIQFTRKYHTAEWYTQVQIENGVELQRCDFEWFYVGQEIDVSDKIPPTAPPGYEFAYWEGYTEGMRMPDEGIRFSPVYAPADGTAFTVKHVRANEYGNYNHEDENLIETETAYGKTEQPAINYVTLKEYTGFEAGAGSTQVTIEGDGSTVITVTYARKKYPINLVLDPENKYEYESFRDSYTPPTEYTYGTVLALPDNSGATKISHPGYDFLGWYLAGDESMTIVQTADTTACTELTYYAKWRENPSAYKVEHYYQNELGSFDVEPVIETLYAVYGTEVSATPNEKEGYTFDEDNANNVLDGKITSVKDNDTVLKVYYIKNEYAIPYTVEHYLQEIDGTYPETSEVVQFFTANLNETVTAQSLFYEGFSEDTTNANAVKSSTITSFDDEVVLKVYYSRNVHTAEFTDYDGTVLGTKECVYGQEIELPEGVATPVRTGYTFSAWQTFGNMGDDDITISAKDAQWKANTYTVEFNANGGQNTMASQHFVYDEEQVLSKNVFTYTNRNFIGWSRTEDGAVEFIDTAKAVNLTAENGGTVKLYAVWELVEGATANYTVEYYLQGVDGNYDTVASSTETKVGGIEETVTISKDNTLTFEGFTFDETMNDALSATVNEDGSTILKVYYTRNTYTLTIDYGADQIKMAYWDDATMGNIVGTKATNPEYAETELKKTVNVVYGGSVADAIADITLSEETGYNFAGWYLGIDKVNQTTVMPAANATVTAKWNAVDVTFTVDPSAYWSWTGNEVTIENNTFTVKYGDTIEAPFVDETAFVGVPEGYVILGWQAGSYPGQGVTISFPFVAVEGYNSYMSPDSVDEEGNISYTISPYWIDQYDILHFEGNGGTGTMADMYLSTVYYQIIPQNTFTRTGYEFAGWSTDPNAVADDYENYEIYYSGSSISGTNDSNETITLYAIWRELPVE